MSIKANYQSFQNSIIDGTDKIENVNSINVTPQISRRMNMQFIKVLKYSIIDGADNIENVCNIDIVIKDMLFL